MQIGKSTSSIWKIFATAIGFPSDAGCSTWYISIALLDAFCRELNDFVFFTITWVRGQAVMKRATCYTATLHSASAPRAVPASVTLKLPSSMGRMRRLRERALRK
jgi:hypothetical protein